MALIKRAKIIGTVLRSRSTEEKADATRAFAEDVLPLIAEGKIKPNLDKIFRMDDVRRGAQTSGIK
jgi:NADPH:quinone reductase-like Zn-dependent oxidoreductase